MWKTAADKSCLAAKVADEPEEEGEAEAQQEAGDDGEIERGVLAAIDNVARKTAEAEGEFAAEIEERPNGDENDAGEKEEFTEVAERVHGESVEENLKSSTY